MTQHPRLLFALTLRGNDCGGAASGDDFVDLKRFDLNLHRITLPEIKDFNALCDASWVKLKPKRYNNAI